MAFEEWLTLGGNEIINNARTVGYARSAACPMGWFKGDICGTLANATQAIADYHDDAIEAAPWYDPVLPEISRRFFGAFGVSVTGIEDSTRTAGVTEGLSDGGVIGRVRKAAREVRVQAVLAAEGQDALEYGMAWLNAALDPNACGQHGDACGTADLGFFSTCPPVWETVPAFTDWVTEAENLVTNPSFEALTGMQTEVRRNLVASHPRLVDSTGDWLAQDGAVSAAGPTGMVVDVPVAAGVNAKLLRLEQGQVNSPGTSWSTSVDVEVPAGFPTVVIDLGLEEESAAGHRGAPITIYAGETVHLSFATTAVSHGTMRLTIHADADFAAGSRFIVSNVMWEKTLAGGPFFDGSTLPAGDWTYLWAGTPEVSESVQYGALVTDAPAGRGVVAVSSQEWSGDRARSLRLIQNEQNNSDSFAQLGGGAGSGMNFGVVAGKTYTIRGTLHLTASQSVNFNPGRARGVSVFVNGGGVEFNSVPTPNEAGDHPFSLTFTLPADATEVFFRLYSGAYDAGEEVWFDNIMLVEGDYTGPYFDGEHTGGEFVQYAWTGTPDASSSTHQVRQPNGTDPIPVEDYLGEVNKVRRYLHDVAAISGPLVQEEMHSGRHWAYLVEFTLAAGNPYVFGVMRKIALPPRLPVVVQDIPYNLITHPSAELASGTVVVARNYALNPSAETDVTSWTEHTDGTKITGAMVEIARSTELDAVGSASVKSLFTATTTDAAGYFGAGQVVPVPFVAGMRLSLNLWASGSVESGTAVVGEIQYLAHWQDASAVTLRTDEFGRNPASGGAVSAKSILPPDGTVQVLIRARLNVTSWSTGAKVRLYADALAVTSP